MPLDQVVSAANLDWQIYTYKKCVLLPRMTFFLIALGRREVLILTVHLHLMLYIFPQGCGALASDAGLPTWGPGLARHLSTNNCSDGLKLVQCECLYRLSAGSYPPISITHQTHLRPDTPPDATKHPCEESRPWPHFPPSFFFLSLLNSGRDNPTYSLLSNILFASSPKNRRLIVDKTLFPRFPTHNPTAPPLLLPSPINNACVALRPP